ncbi:MAG: holin-associated N-acetylmuramidase [Pseudomonadota bacterium]
MLSVDEIATGIVRREGGFVNDPDDPGGATNYGVTIGTLRSVGLDKDGDGDVDIDDIRALTPADAVEIFKRDYYRRPGLDRLPPVLQPTVFDMYVNAGSRAVMILQELLGRYGHPAAVDGIIGPKTLAAVDAVTTSAGAGNLADAYSIERRNFYYRLGDRRPSLRKFARRRDGGKGGWIHRAEEFISARFHLSEAEHRARVATWA